MRLPAFQYVEPRSIDEACLFLEEHGQESKIMGGGTDLLPSMKQRIFKPKYLVNLGGIPNLDRIEFDEGSGLRIGALVKLRSLETYPIILKRYPMIRQAAGEVGSVQIRQMASIGGNHCLDTRCYYYNQSNFWRKCLPRCIKMGGDKCNAIGGGTKCFAVFSGDLAPPLMALGAKIKILSARGERTLLLSEFYTGNGAKPMALGPEEVLVSIEVPAMPKKVFSSYLKYRIRRSIDFPLASVATILILEGKEKVCRKARLVIGAVGTKPEEVKGIQELLEGKRVGSPMIDKASELAFKATKPIANVGSSPSYRKRMIKLFIEKTLKQALEEST
jgi:4-hydroxybenzoyl-CoA reductase subunit beta